MLRYASKDDLEVLCDIMWEIYAEAPEYRDRTIDPLYTREMLNQFLERDDMVVILDNEGRGVFIGIINTEWNTGSLHGCEVLLYVRSAYRGSLLGAHLIKKFEQTCIDLDCEHVSLGISTGITEDRTIELYKRLGYTENRPTVTKRIQ
jgi:GNAT superfamily N-acetyltransferase